METGPEFREEHDVGGVHVVLRHIRPEDATELRRGFAELSSESRYRRFFGAVTELDDRTVHYLTCVDGTNHVAIIALIESLDLKTERGVGVVRFVRSTEDPEAAEIAVTVVDDMQRHGIGTLLSNVAIKAARERGIKRFTGEVLVENAHLVEALRAHPAVQTIEKNGVLSFVIELDPARDITGLLRQMLAVAAQRVFLVLRWLRVPAV